MSALASRRVVVTRPVEQAGELCDLLKARRAIPIPIPTIAIEPPADASPFDDALRRVEEYDWIVLTSANGARALLEFARALGIDLRNLLRARWAAVGPATKHVLAEAGLAVSAVPGEHRSAHIPDALGEVSGSRILLPRSDLAADVLPATLRERGAVVDAVVAYHTVMLTLNAQRKSLLEEGVDAMTFTSPSALRSLVEALGEAGAEIFDLAIIATIGPVTSRAAKALGVRVDVEASESTSSGIVAALESFDGWAAHGTRTAS